MIALSERDSLGKAQRKPKHFAITKRFTVVVRKSLLVTVKITKSVVIKKTKA